MWDDLAGFLFIGCEVGGRSYSNFLASTVCATTNIMDSREGHIKGGRAIVYKGYIMAPSKVPIQQDLYPPRLFDRGSYEPGFMWI